MPVELLAPARDRACGEIAINAGADAVYIGAPRFGARRNAANSVQDIALLIEHAHRYRSRVYVTLNTVLLERELDDAVRLLHQLHEVGIDGAIIQDLGLLESDLPPVPLIASTQTHADSVEKVRFLEAAGFSRVILARELSIPEMAEIRAHTTVELEAFVHGALCVSYSGQCYLSHAIGGRSANRGECAQPCRKRFRLLDTRGKEHAKGHLLSIKDLNRLDVLGDLLDAGITSFKIEGRLKDEAYVANTVAAYRQALDDCLKSRNLPPCTDSFTCAFTPDLDITFHRGYVEGFARGKTRMANFETPKAMGIPVGTVLRKIGNAIEINATEELSPGDGLCFFASDGKLDGTLVQSVLDNSIVVKDATGIVQGTTLFRNYSRQFQNAVKKGIQRKVPIRIQLQSVEADLQLIVEDQHNNRGTAILSGPLESAKNRELIKTKWQTQLEKTGTTEFICDGVELPDTELPFVPVAAMNDLRRRALDTLREARIRSMPALEKREISPIPCMPETLDSTCNITNSRAVAFYQKFGAKQITQGPEAGSPVAKGRVMISKYCLRRELGACLKLPSGKSLPSDLYLKTDDGLETLRLQFDCEQCKMHVIREELE